MSTKSSVARAAKPQAGTPLPRQRHACARCHTTVILPRCPCDRGTHGKPPSCGSLRRRRRDSAVRNAVCKPIAIDDSCLVRVGPFSQPAPHAALSHHQRPIAHWTTPVRGRSRASGPSRAVCILCPSAGRSGNWIVPLSPSAPVLPHCPGRRHRRGMRRLPAPHDRSCRTAGVSALPASQSGCSDAAGLLAAHGHFRALAALLRIRDACYSDERQRLPCIRAPRP